MGGLLRLDWPAVERVLGWYQIEQTDELMRGLHIFSGAYADESNRLSRDE